MEKEQILTSIKEKLGQTSLSERTIENYVSRHLPSDGVEPDDAYFNTHIAELKAFATDYTGQHNHETAAAKSKWEEDWKKSHPETQPVNTPTTSPELAALQKQLDDMKESITAQKKTASIAELRTAVSEKATELKVANKALWNDVVTGITISDNMTKEDLLSAVKTTYESKLKAYVGGGIQPYASAADTVPSVAAQKEALARREAFMARQRAAGNLPQQQNQ